MSTNSWGGTNEIIYREKTFLLLSDYRSMELLHIREKKENIRLKKEKECMKEKQFKIIIWTGKKRLTTSTALTSGILFPSSLTTFPFNFLCILVRQTFSPSTHFLDFSFCRLFHHCLLPTDSPTNQGIRLTKEQCVHGQGK